MIGLFDSGIGGLTVLKSLIEILPNEDYIYLGDTARLPYGTKSQETIKRYTEQNIHFLEAKGVDLVVSACHSASSSILKYKIRSQKPLYNVIEPACADALQQTSTKKIGLLATAATVRAGQYNELITTPYKLFAEPAPLLVPLVENNWLEDIITDLTLERYCAPLKVAEVDTVILGCTHYPLLQKAIGKCFGSRINMIDPGKSLAQKISLELTTTNTKKNSSNLSQKIALNAPGEFSAVVSKETSQSSIPTTPPKPLQIFLTDQSAFFVQLAEVILGRKNLDIQQIDL